MDPRDFLSGKHNIQKGLEMCLETEINSTQPIRNWQAHLGSFESQRNWEMMSNFISISKTNHISKMSKPLIHAGENTQEIKGKCLQFENEKRSYSPGKGRNPNSWEANNKFTGDSNIHSDTHGTGSPSSICGRLAYI